MERLQDETVFRNIARIDFFALPPFKTRSWRISLHSEDLKIIREPSRHWNIFIQILSRLSVLLIALPRQGCWFVLIRGWGILKIIWTLLLKILQIWRCFWRRVREKERLGHLQLWKWTIGFASALTAMRLDRMAWTAKIIRREIPAVPSVKR